MRQGESTFGHHLHEITKAEFVAQIPAHAEDDYFAIEMAAFEEFVHVEHSSDLSFEQSAANYAALTQFAPEPLALRRAVAVRCPSAGLIHHADRGSQYCSVEYQAELRKNGISISMSGKGNCFDNAMVETFFKTLKAELVWRTLFQSRIEAASAIGRYIDGFYNPVRRHSALDFISPLQFEGRAA